MKNIFLITLLLLGLFISAIFICNTIIVQNAKGKLYDDINKIPTNKVGILLGTSKFLKTGYQNPYFKNRIDAAVALLHAKKINYIVLSGDNGTKYYDEPTMMRADLIKAGIDSTKIFLDYAGFRTFDSMVRLKEIFGQDSVTIISQQFHNERALYIAKKEGITAVAFNAKDIFWNNQNTITIREKLARVKVFIDYILHKKPKYLGKKIIIPTKVFTY